MRFPAFLKKIGMFTLCCLLFLQAAPTAFAEMDEAPDERAPLKDLRMLDEEALQAIVDGVIQEMQLNGEYISVAYCYTATGETWYYQPDEWYYSASLYKVPLMMILAEKEYNGEITQETKLNNTPLSYAEEVILVYSNNDYAHLMLNYLGTDQEAREMYKQFSPLPDDYYDPNFIDYSYFTPRFITDVFQTLYYEEERFPNIADKLKLAQPGHFFRLSDNRGYEVAQKYGSYKEFNHTSGIIYTPNPFILTVMTRYTNTIELLGYTLEQKMMDYTLQLDEQLAQAEAEHEQALAAEEAQRLEEEERLAREAEEAQRLEEEERLAREAKEQAAAQEAARREQEEKKSFRLILVAAGAGIVLLCVVGIVIAVTVKRRRREPAMSVVSSGAWDDGWEDEPEEAPLSRTTVKSAAEKKKKNGYVPRH